MDQAVMTIGNGGITAGGDPMSMLAIAMCFSFMGF
jgi:hypothetical protein